MFLRPSVRLPFFALLAILATPRLSYSQSGACPGHPKQAASASQKIKITIVNVEFEGENPLSEAARAQLVDKIQKSNLTTGAEQSDQDWLYQVEQKLILDELRAQGYWRARAEITPRLIQAAAQERFYSLTAAIASGPQYRLKEIYFANSTVFSTTELRKQIPLNPGDLFDVSKVRDGMEAIRSLYLSRGYLDTQIEPTSSIDPKTRLVQIVLKIGEGVQYRVGTVQVFGLDKKTTDALTALLEPGQVFNAHSLHEFMKENKSLLPADASLAKNSQFQRNSNTGAIDMTLDFRPCSKD